MGRGYDQTANRRFNGSMDEVRIWNTARTQSEIRENMHLTLKGNETGLAAYYQFDNDDIGPSNVKDVLGNDGQAYGAPAYSGSEVAVGGGVSETQSVSSSGVVSFVSPGVDIDFGTNTPDGDLVVSRIQTEAPNGEAGTEADKDNEYFVIKNFGADDGSVTPLDIERITFKNISDLQSETDASTLKMYKRTSNAFGSTWGSSIASGSSMTSTDVTFGVDNSNITGFTSFSQFLITSSGATALPVELVNFTASVEGESIVLDWSTASETNNAGFEVLYSDGTDFEVIGYVSGVGTTQEGQDYSFVHADVSAGTHYYQLRQLDEDGTSTTSDVAKVVLGGDVVLSISPNPFTSTTKLSLEGGQSGTVVINVYNSLGQLQAYEELVGYENAIDYDLDLSLSPSGVYVVKVVVSGEEYTTKVVKQ